MKILKTFRKISKFTAFFFSVYFTLFSSFSYAQNSETVKPAQDYFQIAIPQELGTISNSYFTSVTKSDLGKDARPSAGMIIHIQDAHGQLSAQKNIQQILEYLVSKYGFKTLFLEGGLDGKISPDLLRFFKDEAANGKVANKLLEDGRIAGADVFLLKSKGKVSAYGLESEKLYRKNILAFREVISQKKEADVFLAELKKQITSFGSHYFNPDLNKFSKEWLEFQDNRTETLKHLEILDLYANKYLKINLREPKKQFDYPQLVRIFSIKKMEKDYGGESVRPQLQRDLNRLKRWLLEKKLNPAYAQMFESLVNYSYSSLNPTIPVDVRSFLENFYAVAKPKGFSFSRYYVFMKYLGLLLLAQELEPERLFDEIKKMNVEILKSLAGTPEENSLVRLIRDYYLVKKLFALELTRDEYAEIVEKEKIVSPVILTSRLRMLDNSRIKATVNASAELTDLFHSAIRFYDLAQQREDKMFNSMLSVLDGKQEKRIILVTGGFHSRGLETLMRGQNFSFIEVTPKMSQIQSNEKYIEQMLAGASAVPAVSPGKIPLPKIRSLMGEEDFRYFQAAIEQAKAESLGALPTPELARAEIFSGLESELEKLVAEFHIPKDPTVEEQGAFAKAAVPVIEQWVRENQSIIDSKIPSALIYPTQEEQYHRNKAAGSENLGIFTHVWRSGGETRIHDHGGLLGITVPLTAGMEEDQFNFAQESDFGSSHGTVVEITGPKKIVLEKGSASVITKGPGAIHRIRNASPNYGIMLEIYFWLGNPPVQSVNTFVPVEGSASQYLVRHEPVDEITVSLVDKLLKGAGEAVSWMILQRLKEAKLNPKKIPGLLPMFTKKGAAIVDLQKAIDFIGASKFSMPKIMVEKAKPYSYIVDPNSRSQHGASLGEKADPAQVRALLSQHINSLMVIPTLHVFAKRGVFELFGNPSHPKEVSLMQIAQKFNPGNEERNLGNLYGGMRTLALQGYVKIKDVDEKTSYQLTDAGWTAVVHAKDGWFLKVVEAIGNMKNYHKLFRGPPNDQSMLALGEFQTLISTAKVNSQYGDVLMSPVMVALGMPLFKEQKDGSIKEIAPSFFKLFNKDTHTLNLNKIKISHDPKFLDAAFRLLVLQRLAEYTDETKKIVRLTLLGIGLKDMVVSYGVTNSYLNLYEKLDEAFFGNPDPLDIANDGHIDRVMDIWGSSGSHKPYLKNGKGEGILAMVKKIFDGPLDQQPKGIADMGCGDGRMLAEIVEFIIHDTERGKHLNTHPLAVVAADYSPKSQGRAAATLKKFTGYFPRINRFLPNFVRPIIQWFQDLFKLPRIHVEVMFGDVTRPDNYDADIQKRFAARGLEIGVKDLLHTQMFLPHERHLQVKTREEARTIISEHLKTVNREVLKKILKIELPPTLNLIEEQFMASYSDKGKLTPGIVAAADLIQFTSRWTQYTPKGLIILDLHTARLEEIGENKFMLPAYWGTHWISQHIMPYAEHNLCLLLAGLEPSETVFYPAKAPHSVSLSNYLPSQIAKASSLGGKVNGDGRSRPLDPSIYGDSAKRRQGGKRPDKGDPFRIAAGELHYFGMVADFYEALLSKEYKTEGGHLKRKVFLGLVEERVVDLINPSELKQSVAKFVNDNQLLMAKLKPQVDALTEKLSKIEIQLSQQIQREIVLMLSNIAAGKELLKIRQTLKINTDAGRILFGQYLDPESPVSIENLKRYEEGEVSYPKKYLSNAKQLLADVTSGKIKLDLPAKKSKKKAEPAPEKNQIAPANPLSISDIPPPSNGASLGLNLARGMRHVDRLAIYAVEHNEGIRKKSQAQKESDYFRLVRDLLYINVLLGAYDYLIELSAEKKLDLSSVDEFFRDNMFYAEGVRGRMEFASASKIETILDEVESQINVSLYSSSVNLPVGADKVLREDVKKLRNRFLQTVKQNPVSVQIETFRTRLFSPQAEKRREEGAKLKDLMEEKKISALQLFKLMEPDVKPDNPEKERRRTKVDKWQKGIFSIPAEVWTLIEKKPTPVPKLKEKLQVSKPIVPVPVIDMTPVAASSLGKRDLDLAYELAVKAAGGIFRGNSLESAVFAAMAADEQAQKSAKSEPSAAVAAFNKDVTKFIPQSRSTGGVTGFTSAIQQDPFVLIAFADAFGSNLINPEQTAQTVVNNLHTNDFVIGVWKLKKPAIIVQLMEAGKNKIRVDDIPTGLANNTFIRSLINASHASMNVSPVSISSLSDTEDAQLTLNRLARVKFNLDVLEKKGIQPAQVIALIRQIGSNPDSRNQAFFNYGFSFDQQKGFWEVGEGFAKKLEEIYAKSLGDKAIARAA